MEIIDEKRVHAFHDPNKSNKKYDTHKENYIRFALEFLFSRVKTNQKELYKLLEKQYVENSINQHPVIENQKYWFVITL